MNTSVLFNKNNQKGSISMLSAIGFGLLLAICALVVDLGYARMTRGQLQSAADSASIAAVGQLIQSDGTVDAAGARQIALNFAAKHTAGGHDIGLDDNASNATDGDVVVGKYDENGVFVPTTNAGADSVQVAVRRTTANGQPVKLFFAKIFGRDKVDLGAGSTASLVPVYATEVVPLALAVPGFGPVDPTQPYKDGPSGPSNGDHFQMGESVAVYFSDTNKDSYSTCGDDEDDDSDDHGDSDKHGGSGHHSIFGHYSKSKSHGDSDNHGDSDKDKKDKEEEPNSSCEGPSVHLILDLGRNGLSKDAGNVIKGDSEPVPVAIDDEFYVTSKGTGGGDFGNILKNRILSYSSNDDRRTIVVPVVETNGSSRNGSGELAGRVRIVGFVAIHLDGVENETVADPGHAGETIEIEKVVATIVHKVVGASVTREDDGVGGNSVATVRLSS